jgi:hypothetical protein
MAIVLYLMFGAGGGGTMQQAAKTRDNSRQLVININTRDLLTLIANHRVTYDELPADVAALEAAPGSFNDPWGTELVFEYEDVRATPVIVIVTSAGPDGAFDTEDDVVKREQLPF